MLDGQFKLLTSRFIGHQVVACGLAVSGELLPNQSFEPGKNILCGAIVYRESPEQNAFWTTLSP